MEQVAELLKSGRIQEAMAMARAPSVSVDELAERRIEREVANYNRDEGFLHLQDGIDCPACKNRGFIATVSRECGYSSMVLRRCNNCAPKRESMRLIARSGLKDSLDRCRFESFQAREPWQRDIRDAAMRYVRDRSERAPWLYMGGQSGAGKTHLCTAVCGQLLEMGEGIRYMLWTDVSTQLKGLKTDQDEYQDLIYQYKATPTLYIDDLFKTQRGQQPTPADIILAFEILNCRYIDSKKRTIISSEMMIDDVIMADEALGSRILERSKGYVIDIPRSTDRNWRTR